MAASDTGLIKKFFFSAVFINLYFQAEVSHITTSKPAASACCCPDSLAWQEKAMYYPIFA